MNKTLILLGVVVIGLAIWLIPKLWSSLSHSLKNFIIFISLMLLLMYGISFMFSQYWSKGEWNK